MIPRPAVLPDGFGDQGAFVGAGFPVAAMRVHTRKSGTHFLKRPAFLLVAQLTKGFANHFACVAEFARADLAGHELFPGRRQRDVQDVTLGNGH